MLAIAIIFAHSRRISSSSSSCPATTALPDHVHDLHDDGSQKPDDTTDD